MIETCRLKNVVIFIQTFDNTIKDMISKLQHSTINIRKLTIEL